MKTAKDILAEIDELLLASTQEDEGQEARRLWNVLAALRGPDGTNYDWATNGKATATIPIRRAAFPRYTAMWDRDASFGGPAFGHPSQSQFKEADGATLPHFRHHAEEAWESLKVMGLVS